jgi:interferon gamma-inducible protein 30
MLEQVGTITNFTAWPYGNAKESQYNSTYYHFSCQHGTSECIGNMYEACAIEHYPTVTNGIPDWWPFFLCLEKSGNAGSTSTASNCAKNHNIDWNVITECSTTSQPQYGSQADGNPLMHQIAQWTANMQPPHQYTPWITVDGKLWSSGSLTQMVCDAYTGSNPPSACRNFEGMSYREEAEFEFVDFKKNYPDEEFYEMEN